MDDILDTILSEPVSPLPIEVTSETTLEDVIAATIFDKPATANQLVTDSNSTPANHKTNSFISSSPAESRFDESLFSLLDSPAKSSNKKSSPEGKSSLLESTPASSALSDNPYFTALQSILQTDCKSNDTPQVLLKAVQQQSSSTLQTREHRLQQRFDNLKPIYASQVAELSSFHKYQAALVETDRFRALHENSQQPLMQEILNDYYDNMLHRIIDRVEVSVGNLEDAMMEQKKAVKQKPFQLNLRSRPVLSQKAIKVMEEWYYCNMDHPYPKSSVVVSLAEAGGIKEEQVKKWFANKRSRSNKTKSMVEISKRRRYNSQESRNTHIPYF